MNRSVRIVWLTLICFSACVAQTRQEVGSRYFTSPQESVERISDLVRNKQWTVLSEYYDLAGSNLDRQKLQSEEFFMRTERPANADPAGFWRYRHPFPPGFAYLTERPSNEPNVFIIVVFREIDQGGGPAQKALAEFQMRKSARGFQILPS
jgi:hypothetical protein